MGTAYTAENLVLDSAHNQPSLAVVCLSTACLSIVLFGGFEIFIWDNFNFIQPPCQPARGITAPESGDIVKF